MNIPTKPIRILHILQRMEPAGIQTFLMNVYRHIDRSQIQFDFLVHYTKPDFYDKEITALGGRVFRLSFREDLNPIKYVLELRKFFREHPEYQIVHGHMNSLGAVYLKVAKDAGVPVRIAHAHTDHAQNDWKRPLKLWMNRRFSSNATNLFASSKAAGEFMFPDQSFTVINNGIDFSKFKRNDRVRLEVRKELSIAPTQIVLGNVGRFEISKNHRFIIDVFNIFHERKKSSVLLLVGDGRLRPSIEEYCRELGLGDSVKFLGNRADVERLYSAMDAFIFPSLFEGLGIVALEAQAASLPVVCTATLPQEINITQLVHRVSLEEDANVWATSIEHSLQEVVCQKSIQSDLKQSGFDIDSVTQELEKFYISQCTGTPEDSQHQY